MHITLSPQRRDDLLVVSKLGETLTINGEDFDFSVIPDGSTLPATAVSCPFLVGNIDRLNGEIHLTIILPVGRDATDSANFPSPLINPLDGILELPQ